MLTLKQRHEGDKVARYMVIRRKDIWGRGNSQCKGPEAETCLVYGRSSWEASVARAETEMERGMWDEVREWSGGWIPRMLLGCGKVWSRKPLEGSEQRRAWTDLSLKRVPLLLRGWEMIRGQGMQGGQWRGSCKNPGERWWWSEQEWFLAGTCWKQMEGLLMDWIWGRDERQHWGGQGLWPEQLGYGVTS